MFQPILEINNTLFSPQHCLQNMHSVDGSYATLNILSLLLQAKRTKCCSHRMVGFHNRKLPPTTYDQLHHVDCILKTSSLRAAITLFKEYEVQKCFRTVGFSVLLQAVRVLQIHVLLSPKVLGLSWTV
jgi:hypothetical protein